MKYQNSYKIDYSLRVPKPEVDELFHQRWSPRSFRKIEIKQNEMESIIDAARWSQSAFNEQPWRFLTSTDGTFDKFLNLLVDRNQMWAKNASVLGFIITKKQFSHNEKTNRWANFDTGAAWMGLTLQARKFGLYTHGMAGIKQDEVYEAFGIDKAKYRVICAFAIGVIDEPDKLDESFRKMEKPSSRKPLDEIWKVGEWREKSNCS
jgi:nitroreductase